MDVPTVSDRQVSDSVKAMLAGSAEHFEGLSTDALDAARQKYGFNEVVVKEQPVYLQILSRYLGIVPLFMLTTAILSAAIFTDCTENPEYVNLVWSRLRVVIM